MSLTNFHLRKLLMLKCFLVIFFKFFQVIPSNPEKKLVEKDVLRDQGSKKGTIRSMDEILVNGGCKHYNTIYENGQQWNPVLPSHGVQKCVNCHCKVNHLTIFKILKTIAIAKNVVPNLTF